MKRKKLSQRKKNIISLIAASKDNFITVQDIAKELDTSTRTIQRDLVDCEAFLEENDFNLLKKPGQGIKLQESQEDISYLLELLDMVDSSKQYEREDRTRFILSRLLVSDQYIKYYAFTNYLNISEKTLVSDLNQIEEYLKDFNLSLSRKRGEGLKIIGEEYNLRKAQSSLIYESLDDSKRISLLKDISDQFRIDYIRENDVLSMINKDTIDKVKSVLNMVFDEINITISDNAYVALVVHISLAIERLDQEVFTTENEEYLALILDSQEYIFAKNIVKRLEDSFGMKIPVMEVSYIAMHLKGANIVIGDNSHKNLEDVLEATNVAKGLIARMDLYFDLGLMDDQRLLDDLKAHITPAISRLKMNLRITNPILDDIKENYPEIFNILLDIGPQIIIDNSSLNKDTKIPEDEIGYLAIHFITSIERRILDQDIINLVTVCPTGFGTSKFLGEKLKERFLNLNVLDNISVFSLKEQYLKENKIDLVVSTLDITSMTDPLDVPIITISTLPSEKDFASISKILRNLSRSKVYGEAIARFKSKIELASKEFIHLDIEDTKSINEELDNEYQIIYKASRVLGDIFEKIDYFKLYSKDITREVSSFFGKDQGQIIHQALDKRNQLGSTYVKELNLHLLHCSADIEDSILSFGKSKGDLVCLMVLRKDHFGFERDFFSNISVELLENSQFIDYISKANLEKIRETIYKIMINIISKIKED